LSVRDLRKQITTKTFERTTIANVQINSSEHHIQNTFKDPYLLDFLNLGDAYLEKDLELAILKDLE
jgi:predicted nuclease of restriction endonuclease-like (RecB) superfamily